MDTAREDVRKRKDARELGSDVRKKDARSGDAWKKMDARGFAPDVRKKGMASGDFRNFEPAVQSEMDTAREDVRKRKDARELGSDVRKAGTHTGSSIRNDARGTDIRMDPQNSEAALRPSQSSSGKTRSLVAWCMRLPRTLRLFPTRLGRFCISSMLPQDGAPTGGSTDLYPCPLPYTWACGPPPRGGHARARWAKSWARKFWTNACVLALNYFALGQPSWCPTAARHGRRLSVAQAALVRSVEARCEAMLRESLVWDGGKIRTAHEATATVANMMAAAGLDGAAYIQESDRSLGDFGRGGGPARHVVADRVALPKKAPFFDPVPFLPPEAATIYERPREGELPSASDTPQRDELRRCCLLSGKEERELAKRMDEVQMLGLVRASEVSRPGGMFGVDKKPDPATGEVPLRLIFDRRPRNRVEVPLRDLCATLAQGCVLCDMILEKDERARLWLSDLPNYYYTFLCTPERMKTNAWGHPISRAEAQSHSHAWAALTERGETDAAWFYRAANTLPMGDTNAVEFGQGAHVGMLRNAGCMQSGEALIAQSSAPRGSVWQGVVVDDHAIIARTADPGSETGPSPALLRARELWAAAHEAYDAAGLSPVPEKSLVEVAQGRVWGAWLDGDAGTVGVPRTRRAELALVSLDVAALGWCSRGLRRQLVGLWVHPALYRRELLCVLERLFDDLNGENEDDRDDGRVTGLKPGQRDELALLSLLAPCMETNLRAGVVPTLYTSDASPDGAGGTEAPLPPEVAKELWRFRERRGFSATLEQHEALYLKATGRGEAPAEGDAAPNREWASEVVAGTVPRVVQRFRFRARHHINVGEMRARRALLRRFASRVGGAQTRRLVAYDSRVTIGVAAKGRSPSRALNHEQRRTMPYLVGPDIQEGALWVDSKRNPADYPSRGRPLPQPQTPAPWVSAFLSGDLTALDHRIYGIPPKDSQKGKEARGNDLGDGPTTDVPEHARRAREQRAAGRPSVVLADAAKGEVATRDRRARFLSRFLEWSAGRGGVVDLADADPREVDQALEAYGQHLYDTGAGAAELAETINAVAKEHRHLRRQLGAAWDSQRAWEDLEPGSSHSPLPAELCMAIAVVALAWKWIDFAALLLIGFHAALRPGEMVALKRRTLLLPEDLLGPAEIGFVIIDTPKTKKRSARKQHVKLHGTALLAFLSDQASQLTPDQYFWGPDGSAASRARLFRAQWDALLQALRVESSDTHGFVPASIRAGGITWMYQQTHDLQLIRWIGRWEAEKTVEHYLQEAPAALAAARLPSSVRQRIRTLAGLLPDAIRRTAQRRRSV